MTSSVYSKSDGYRSEFRGDSQKNRKLVGELEFTPPKPGDQLVRISNMRVSGGFGFGLGRIAVGRFIEVLSNARLSQGVELQADGVGSYFWFRCGFVPCNDRELRIGTKEILKRFERLQVRIPRKTREVLKHLLRGLNKDPRLVWEISDLRDVVVDERQFPDVLRGERYMTGQRMPLGAALLAGLESTVFLARLSFADEEQMIRAKRYTSLKGVRRQGLPIES